MSDLPPEIEDLDDYTESINILIHGDTGCGKTVMTGALPNTLFISVEEGTISAKRSGSKAKVWRVRHWDDLVAAYEWLRDNPGHPFKWVVIDSVTAAQSRCLRAILEEAVANNPKRDPDIPAIQDHFKWQLMIKRMVTDFNELPVNTIWLARSMNKEDPEGEDIVVPLIEGKDYQISAWVSGEVHLLAYMKKTTNKQGKIVRKLYTNEHKLYWCKDRYDILEHVITNPDLRKIVKQIEDSGASPEVKPSSTKSSATKAGTKKKATRKRAATK
jgi:hypothetical protein